MPYNPNQPRKPAGQEKGGEWTRQDDVVEGIVRKYVGLKGNVASTEQAIQIIKMQSYGYSPKEIEQYLKENGIDYVDGYHVSSIDSAKGIKENGIKLSYQEGRRDASYFFLDRNDVADNADNLGYSNGKYAIITIRIPRTEASNIAEDNFYNGTFSSSYSASRLFKKIPADWIRKIEIREN